MKLRNILIFCCICQLFFISVVSGAYIETTNFADGFGFDDVIQTCNNSEKVVLLNITNPQRPINAFICNILYNTSIIEIVNISHSELTKNWSFCYLNYYWGTRVAAVYDGTNRIERNGSIAQITFQIKDIGQTSLNISDIQLSDQYYNVGTAQAYNTTLIIWQRGDLNDNGDIADIGDVGLMWLAFLGLRPTDCRYDLNNDGKEASISDVRLIWQMWQNKNGNNSR